MLASSAHLILLVNYNTLLSPYMLQIHFLKWIEIVLTCALLTFISNALYIYSAIEIICQDNQLNF